MVMTDPIGDMLTRVRNGYLARKKVVEVPFSRIKVEIGKILVREGFLAKMEMEGKKPTEKKMVLTLKYKGKRPVLNSIKRFSKPGVRIYTRVDKIPRVRLGFGITILSTPAGLVTDKEARKKNVGGEIICQVW